MESILKDTKLHVRSFRHGSHEFWIWLRSAGPGPRVPAPTCRGPQVDRMEFRVALLCGLRGRGSGLAFGFFGLVYVPDVWLEEAERAELEAFVGG